MSLSGKWLVILLPSVPSELVEDGMTGLLTPVKSPEKIAEVIKHCSKSTNVAKVVEILEQMGD
jgi:hypothetical protein